MGLWLTQRQAARLVARSNLNFSAGGHRKRSFLAIYLKAEAITQ
jgi:hypothetical protein